MQLTRLASFQRHSGVTDPALAPVLQQLIIQVSGQVQDYCFRKFESTAYRQWVDGTGHEYLNLEQWPITRIYGISTNSQTVATVTSTGTKVATVGCDGTSLFLFDVTTGGVENDNALAFSDNLTLSDLETTVDALTWWSMTIESGKTNDASNLIRSFRGRDALDVDAKLDAPDQFISAAIAAGHNRSIVLGSDATWPRGKDNIFVWYKAGYTLPSDATNSDGDLPDGLILATNRIVQEVYANRRNNTAMESESIADHSMTFNVGAVKSSVANHHQELLPYIRIAE